MPDFAVPRHRRHRFALALTSGGLLSLAYVYPYCFVLAWIGLVPLLLALRGAGRRESYALGVAMGLALYVGSTYWVAEFLVALKGYGTMQSLAVAALYWIYSAQAWGIIALLYAWLARAAAVPRVVLFPVIVVTVCIGFPTLFTTRFGETQSHFLPAVQAIEFTGLYGLDFLIALANAVLYRTLAPAPDARERAAMTWAAAVVLLWFGYGLYAVGAWKRDMEAWDTVRIGLVQSNEAPSIGIPAPHPGYSRAYPPEMPLTAALARAGAEVVIWPETRFKGYFEHEHVRRAYQHELAVLEVPLLFHDQHRVYGNAGVQEYNTAVFLGRDGNPAGTYRKIQRIAFGEYIPLVSGIPALRAWLLSYFAFNEIAPGNGPAVFRTGRLALTPLICYEVAFPLHVAESLAGRPEGKVLVTLSNDSWFGATRQPFMHGYTSALRAVEHRVPLVHVLNNGPSLVVAPDGRFLFRGDFRAAGGYLVDLPYAPDRGGSLFSRHPYWFISVLYAVLALAFASAALRARRVRPKAEPQRPPDAAPRR